MRNKRRVSEAIVGIMKDAKEEKSLIKVLDLLPISQVIKRNDVVVITPNWVKAKPPYTGTVVGPDTLRTLIKYVKRYDPQRIIIATGSGGDGELEFRQQPQPQHGGLPSVRGAARPSTGQPAILPATGPRECTTE